MNGWKGSARRAADAGVDVCGARGTVQDGDVATAAAVGVAAAAVFKMHPAGRRTCAVPSLHWLGHAPAGTMFVEAVQP